MMSVTETIRTRSTPDIYPSRGRAKAGFIDRVDPVVYSANTHYAPIAEHLVKQFAEQGFIVLDDVFSNAEISRLAQERDRLRQDEQIKNARETVTELGGGAVRSIFRIHAISKIFKKLAADPRLGGLAAYLLGDQVYIHQSRLNYKPGFRGKEFYWHSDFETWHVEDGMPAMRALSMSVVLTENYPSNGPLMIIPGSHRKFVVCEGETPPQHYHFSLKKQEHGVPSDSCIEQLVAAGGIVTATGKPGSVIIFDCNVMHGSNGNITPFPRSNAFFVYNALSNRVLDPFGDHPPRPEYLCTRQQINPLSISNTHHWGH